MITAKEARELAIDSVDIYEILDEIVRVSRKGRFHLDERDITIDQQEALKTLGYEIEILQAENCFRIKW